MTHNHLLTRATYYLIVSAGLFEKQLSLPLIFDRRDLRPLDGKPQTS